MHQPRQNGAELGNDFINIYNIPTKMNYILGIRQFRPLGCMIDLPDWGNSPGVSDRPSSRSEGRDSIMSGTEKGPSLSGATPEVAGSIDL